ncbi:DMT family transporter [Brumimicrobium oceani]|uniref:EamA family transporter n=1 Tax=Brumimicrobium oceani TaxID=2100725 RepID=A0A2U2XDB8_9FLAO|nr:DMT family transporter [Brumimicrobium oceani]PWH85782.1 EamA family transporter [Brumimicrobium oceani]
MNKGILYMILSGLCYIIVNVLVKILGEGPDQDIISGLQKYPIPEIILFRSIITFSICLAVIRSKGIPLLGNNKKWLVIRGVTGTIALTLYFYTLNNLPIAIAATIQYLSPIFTVILAIFILKEKVKPIQGLFFLIAFLGIVFISFSKYFSEDDSISNVNPLWIIVGVISAAFAGMAYNAIAKLRHTDAPITVVFYFPLIAIPIMAVLTAFDYVVPQGKEWGIILVIGVFTHIAQIFATKSLHSANTATVTPFKYLGSIYAFVLGLFLFDEIISLYAIAGMLLIIAGVLGNTIVRGRVLRKEKLGK